MFNPKLFCAALEQEMSSWRDDGITGFLDRAFADDLLVYATSHHDTIRLLEELVPSLGQVGLKLNTSKTKI